MLVPIVPFLVIGELPGQRWLLAAGDGALAFGATGAALLASDLLLPVPSSLIGSLLGARLGAVAGFAWAYLGLSAGAIVDFAVGRLVPSRFATELPGRPTALLLFVSRPVPVLAEAAALAAGAGRVPFGAFLVASLAGNLLYAAALAFAGARAAQQAWSGPALAVPMLLPVAAYLVWRAIRARSR